MKKFTLAAAGMLVALTALPSLADEGTAAPLRTRRTDLLQRDVPAPTAPVATTATAPVLNRTGYMAAERVVPPQAEPAPLPVVAAESQPWDADVSVVLAPISEVPGVIHRDASVVVGQDAETLARIRQETAALVWADVPVISN